MPGADAPGAPSPSRSFAIAGAVIGGLTAAAYGEHWATSAAGRRLAVWLPGGPQLWKLAGHGAFFGLLAAGVSNLWGRGMRKIEATTEADPPRRLGRRRHPSGPAPP